MDLPEPAVQEPVRRPGVLGTLQDLLSRPLAVFERAQEAGIGTEVRLLAGAAVCFLLYGAAAGLFQGGSQVWITALKAPLIIGFALLLCLPSLFVFSALAGADWSGRRFLSTLAGFAATLGLLLAALLPIAWLFSVSSRYLASAVWLHVTLWLLAILVAGRFLRLALAATGAKGAGFLWLVLFFLVSFQVATLFRPVLWRGSGTPVFVRGKMSFLEHLGKVYELDEKKRTAEREAAAKAAEAEKKKQEAEAKKKQEAGAKKKSGKAGSAKQAPKAGSQRPPA